MVAEVEISTWSAVRSEQGRPADGVKVHIIYHSAGMATFCSPGDVYILSPGAECILSLGDAYVLPTRGCKYIVPRGCICIAYPGMYIYIYSPQGMNTIYPPKGYDNTLVKVLPQK